MPMDRDTSQALADERACRAGSDDELAKRLAEATRAYATEMQALRRLIIALEVRIETLERERRAR